MLKISEIFRSIQTEGPLAGTPAVFVRLAGCNLNCDFCDETQEVKMTLSPEDIVKIVYQRAKNQVRLLQHVIITGGEPFVQIEELSTLVNALHHEGYFIQIETNGAVYTDYSLFPFDLVDMIVCSPKGNELIADALIDHITHFKFLVDCGKGMSLTALSLIQRGRPDKVYLQPIYTNDDTKTSMNAKYTALLVQEFGCRLSLQSHKYIGIP